MLVLPAEDVRALLPYDVCVAALEATLASPANVPARTHLDAGSGLLLVMPAYQREPAGMGVKLVSIFPGNPERGLERIQGVYAYLDGETGQPLALMDGRALTAVRTAAVSALGTRLLANRGPFNLAVFGTGVQAHAHVDAMRALFPVRRVLVRGRTPEQARAFAADIGGEAAATAEQALEANLICTCTTSPQPLFDGSRLRPGTHINAVGNYRPEGCELDEATIVRARVAVDTYEGALAEAGDLLQPLRRGAISRSHILADLPELVRGEKKVRGAPEEITVFKSVGHALQDLALARAAWQRATAARSR